MLGNLGVAFHKTGRDNKAVEFFTKHFNISRELGDRAGESSPLHNLEVAKNASA